MMKRLYGSILGVLMTIATTSFAATPEFINTEANHIKTGDNPGLWADVAKRLKGLEKGDSKDIVRILHIGDSHIQAEMGTSQLRSRLQERYGNGGRGLITAFKLAGTNQPVDYAITAENPVDSQARLLKRPWPITPGFTGVASSSNKSNRITFKNLSPEHRFDRATIFTSNGSRNLRWPEQVDSASFWAFPGEKVYGVYTANGKPGVIYSTIGNNGACFSDYLLIDGFADATSQFQPDIIILSMGTNEGFSTMTDAEITSTTLQLIDDLKKANPQAAFMLWTPMECQRDGEVNRRVAEASKLLVDAAGSRGIPVWDFRDVAGGDGASSKWLDAGLMNKDRIHLYKDGYVLQGDLAADAFIEMIDALARRR